MDAAEQAAVDRVCTQYLGVPAAQCPPNHFHLLRLPVGDADPEVVKKAAAGQAAKLKGGKLPADLDVAAKVVLKAVERAAICLSDPDARLSYIEMVRARSKGAGAPARPSATSEPRSRVNSKSKNFATAGPVARAPLSRLVPPKSPAKQRAWLLPAISGGCIAAIALVVVAYFSLRGSEPRKIDGNSLASVDAASHNHLTPSETEPTPEPEESAGPPSTQLTAPEASPDVAADDAPLAGSESGIAQSEAQSRQADVSAAGSSNDRKVPKPTRDRFNIASGPPSRPKAAPPAATQLPLAQIAEVADLPLLMAIDSALADPDTKPSKTVLLGKAEPGLLKDTVVKIDQPKIRTVKRASFYAEPIHDNGEEFVELRLKAESTSELVRAFEEPVAKIYVKEGDLVFEWLEPKFAAVADRLRNCVLQLEHPSGTKRIALRETKLVDCHKINLQEVKSVIPITGDYLPTKEAMHLQVTGANFGGRSCTLRPESGCVECNRDVELIVEGTPLPVKFEVRLTSNENGPCVSVVPRFELSNRWRSYSAERVTDAISGLEKSIVDNERAIARAKRDLPNVQSRLGNVRSQLPHAPANRAAILHGQAQSLDNQVNSLQSKIRRLSDQIPESRRMAGDMHKLVAVGNELHLKAEIGFRIYVPTESGEYDLLRSPVPAKKSPTRSSGNGGRRPT